MPGQHVTGERTGIKRRVAQAEKHRKKGRGLLFRENEQTAREARAALVPRHAGGSDAASHMRHGTRCASSTGSGRRDIRSHSRLKIACRNIRPLRGTTHSFVAAPTAAGAAARPRQSWWQHARVLPLRAIGAHGAQSVDMRSGVRAIIDDSPEGAMGADPSRHERALHN